MNIIQALSDTFEAYGSNHPAVGNLLVLCYGKPIGNDPYKIAYSRTEIGEIPMGWMGKIVGGTIGFAFGGPLGAIFGAAFGHAFDTGTELDSAGTGPRLSTGRASSTDFFCSRFFHACQIGAGGWPGEKGRNRFH
jgi:hypothetical protein